MKRTNKIVAEICLYGTNAVGAGWLARTAGGRMFGDGSPKMGRAFTEAVWQACDAVRADGIESGSVKVYSPDGQRVATADLGRPGYYGDLKWQAAQVYTVTAEQI